MFPRRKKNEPPDHWSLPKPGEDMPEVRFGSSGGRVPSASPKERAKFQFSLKELLLLVTAAALLLSVIQSLPESLAGEYLAGLAGLAALLSMGALAATKPDRAIVHLAWWLMMVVYLICCAAVIVLRDG